MSITKYVRNNGMIIYETMRGSYYTSDLENKLVKLEGDIELSVKLLKRTIKGLYVGVIDSQDAFVKFADNNLAVYAAILHKQFPDEKFIEIRTALENQDVFLLGIPKLIASRKVSNIEELIIYQDFACVKSGHVLVAKNLQNNYLFTTPVLKRL